MKIFLDAGGIKTIQKSLQGKIHKLQDMTQFWKDVGIYVQKLTTNERFDKEQTPEGVKWKPLSPARVKQRLKKHKKKQMRILKDNGDLRESITYEAGKDYVRVGSNLKYAATHQFGRGNIPARPYLGITDSEKLHILSLCRAYLKHHIFKGGG